MAKIHLVQRDISKCLRRARPLGLAVIPLTPTIARQLGATEGTKGIVVTVVDASSDASTKGLQRGDIILSAGYRQIGTVADLTAAVTEAKAAKREALLLRVQRRGQPALYIPVRLR